MQQRHKDRKLYFTELANTSREFYIDYVKGIAPVKPGTRVLEIGCGEGGNLLPFAEIGCEVTGIDIDTHRIELAIEYFAENNQKGNFIASDFLAVPIPETEEQRYDIVLIHDVIEHIEPPYKVSFLELMMKYMRQNAVAFFGFPAWQMPFGGHQQICVSKISKVPFIHLLPTKLYKALLTKCKEPEATINEMLSIKRSKMPVERFEKIIKQAGLKVLTKRLWLINPHYKQKFGLSPVREVCPFDKIPWLRNFYSTSAWYVLKKG